MFRSLFARMLITISLVLTVSFLILSLILANFANEYELERYAKDLVRTAKAAHALTEDILLSEEGEGVDPDAIGWYSAIFRVYLSNTEETVLLFCDTEGRVVISEDGTDTPPAHVGMLLPAEILAAAEDEGQIYPSATFSDAEQRYPYCVYVLEAESGEPLGYLVAYSTMESFGGMTQPLINTVLLTSLWIILGALVVLYLFCERIAGPLREMSHVTKSFSKGKFDTRVAVVGNDEIATLGKAFNQMAESLEQLETMRNSFISNVSHDLRTPMTTILGFIEGITGGAVPEEKKDYYLGVIAEEVRRLSRLVTELLDLSRLESGSRKFNFTNFDICEMARLILIANEQRIDEKRLEVAFMTEADNILVTGDKDAIHQVLYNLCDNAIKFAREGAALTITIAPQGRRKIAVTVYNEGDGIAEEDVPYVFDRFYKSDESRGRDRTGAGLGLYISKTIMDAHGETMSLESVAGQSCAFTFTLPAAGE